MDEHKLSSQQAGRMQIEAEGQLRDRLARERTKLAIERTFLAYVRTALAFVVVGIPASFMSTAFLPVCHSMSNCR